MMSHEELLSKLGLGGEPGADAIEGAFNDLLRKRGQEVKEAENKFERLAAKRSLKEVEALRADVVRTVTRERVENLLNRFTERLQENRVGAAKVALKEARRLATEAGIIEDFRLQLEEAGADLEEAAGPEVVEEKVAAKGGSGDDAVVLDSQAVEPESPPVEPEFEEEPAVGPEPEVPAFEEVSEAAPRELRQADRWTLVHRETGERIHFLMLSQVVFGRSRDCDVMVRVRHPDGGREEDLANRRISRRHFRMEAVNGMVIVQDGSLSDKGRVPSTGGTCLDGQRIQSEILQSGRASTLQLTTQEAGPGVPHWQLDYVVEAANRISALRMRRLDLVKEDVVLLWDEWKGELSAGQPEITLRASNGGVEYSGPGGSGIDWLEQLERVPEGSWRLSSAGLGSLEYTESKEGV